MKLNNKNFLNKDVNPPCYSSSATSFIIRNKEFNGRRGQDYIPFCWGVASDERELAIDEGVSGISGVSNLQFVPDLIVVVREGEECVREFERALEEVEAIDSRTEEASEGDSFVDIMGSLEKETEVIRKDSQSRTFCNVQIFCQKLCWRVWSILLICHCVGRHSSYSVSFYL